MNTISLTINLAQTTRALVRQDLNRILLLSTLQATSIIATVAPKIWVIPSSTALIPREPLSCKTSTPVQSVLHRLHTGLFLFTRAGRCCIICYCPSFTRTYLIILLKWTIISCVGAQTWDHSTTARLYDFPYDASQILVPPPHSPFFPGSLAAVV